MFVNEIHDKKISPKTKNSLKNIFDNFAINASQ